MNTTLFHVYDKGKCGLMDYIRGTAYLIQQFSDEYEIVPVIMAPIRYLLANPGPYMQGDVHEFFTWRRQTLPLEEHKKRLRELRDGQPALRIITNYMERPAGVFPKSLRDLFVLREPYQQQFEEFYRQMTGGESYRVVHCRLGDSFVRKGSGARSVFQKQINALKSLDFDRHRYLLVADDPFFKEAVREERIPFYRISPIRAVHTALCTAPDALAQTFFETLLFTRAEHVTCYSSLPWGRSGFSRVPCGIFGVPYKGVKVR